MSETQTHNPMETIDEPKLFETPEINSSEVESPEPNNANFLSKTANRIADIFNRLTGRENSGQTAEANNETGRETMAKIGESAVSRFFKGVGKTLDSTLSGIGDLTANSIEKSIDGGSALNQKVEGWVEKIVEAQDKRREERAEQKPIKQAEKEARIKAIREKDQKAKDERLAEKRTRAEGKERYKQYLINEKNDKKKAKMDKKKAKQEFNLEVKRIHDEWQKIIKETSNQRKADNRARWEARLDTVSSRGRAFGGAVMNVLSIIGNKLSPIEDEKAKSPTDKGLDITTDDDKSPENE